MIIVCHEATTKSGDHLSTVRDFEEEGALSWNQNADPHTQGVPLTTQIYMYEQTEHHGTKYEESLPECCSRRWGWGVPGVSLHLTVKDGTNKFSGI